MTTTKVVEIKSQSLSTSPIQDYAHPDYHAPPSNKIAHIQWLTLITFLWMNSVKLKSQTAKATRYVDITTDFWNALYLQPPISLEPLIGIFERAVSLGSWAIVTLNVAFMAGSSKHGKAFRAYAGENWVAATCLKWNERKSKSNAFHAKCLRIVKNNIWLSWTNIIDLTILLSYSFQKVINRKK